MNRNGKQRTWLLAAGVASAVALTLGVSLAQEHPKVGYKDTPMLPGGKWHVHDGDRPQPKVITAGTCSTQDDPGKPPSDAVVLFDGKDLSHWRLGDGKPANWKVEDGALITAAGTGPIYSREEFGDCQLHVEFTAPTPPSGRDQGRGNSGVMLFGRYEIQVLDSFENVTYADGQAAAIYGQYPPLVNASRPPGQWQTYDIVFLAPKFREDGSLESPAYVTMLHNGVLVHDHAPLIGEVAFRAVAKYSPHGPKGPISLQDHGNPVRFRNIWAREIEREEHMTPTTSKKEGPQLAHMVFFGLKDRTEAAREKLVASCEKYLGGHEGVAYFSVGTIAEDVQEPVSDREFDVALHLIFENKGAEAKYLTDPRHLKFIEENKDSWSNVRVFDSYLSENEGEGATP